jgi:hypothetical protein
MIASSSAGEGAAPAGSQGGQQQRRRRRRRKTTKIALPPESQAALPPSAESAGELTARQAAHDQGFEQAREQGRESARETSRDQSRDQVRDQPRPQIRDQQQVASREASGPEGGRSARGDERARQGRSQQAQGKKQGRQARGGGGSSQGRQFSKPVGQPHVARESNPGNGSSGQPAAGARRKNKVRRTAPTFVGPMDHSYRTVNGNIADGSPSTMDYRSNTSNGNGNGNVHGRNGYSDAELTVPALLREDAPVRIVCFIEDLFVVAKMQETARKLGVKVSFAKAEKDTVAKLMEMPEAERPSLIVFDLNNANAKPLTLIPKLKAKLKRGTSVIGFLSHIQGDLKMKAIEAGCDTVMPKAAFSQNLPNLLRRHGLDEEPEYAEV